MCGLCGVLAGRGHWADAERHPDTFVDRARTHTWHRERQDRTRLVNRVLRHYGLHLDDWAATSFVLRTATGRTALVDNLNEVWIAAESLTGRDCDPLDPTLLAGLAAGDR